MSAVLETNRGDILSGFSEAVRDLLLEARLVFKQDGVHLYGRDGYNLVAMQYCLPADKLAPEDQGSYRCDAPVIEVGIDTKFMAKCLSSVSCGDLVSFSVDTANNPDHLLIRCQNPATGKRCSWSLVTPTPDDEDAESMSNVSIEQGQYNNRIDISSLLFHDMMHDLIAH
jgi:hypothetical protein